MPTSIIDLVCSMGGRHSWCWSRQDIFTSKIFLMLSSHPVWCSFERSIGSNSDVEAIQPPKSWGITISEEDSTLGIRSFWFDTGTISTTSSSLISLINLRILFAGTNPFQILLKNPFRVFLSKMTIIPSLSSFQAQNFTLLSFKGREMNQTFSIHDALP